jgi:hypothetical protein
MIREYIVETTPDGKEVISYTEGGLTFTFLADESNSDYQRYLNPKAEQSTPIVIDETKTK